MIYCGSIAERHEVDFEGVIIRVDCGSLGEKSIAGDVHVEAVEEEAFPGRKDGNVFGESFRFGDGRGCWKWG